MNPANVIRKNELAALGLLNWQPMHGYLLNQTVQKLAIEQWANISQSSIYYALGKLSEQGAVTVTTERDGKSPERTVYHITDLGREILADQLRGALATVSTDDRLFYLAMSFVDALPVPDTVRLLTQRIGELEDIANSERCAADESTSRPHLALLCEAGARHMLVERDACRELIDLLQDQPDYFTKLGGMGDDT